MNKKITQTKTKEEPKKKTPRTLIGSKYSNKMNWGGRTDRGYVHYETPDGEKISVALSKNQK